MSSTFEHQVANPNSHNGPVEGNRDRFTRGGRLTGQRPSHRERCSIKRRHAAKSRSYPGPDLTSFVPPRLFAKMIVFAVEADPPIIAGRSGRLRAGSTLLIRYGKVFIPRIGHRRIGNRL